MILTIFNAFFDEYNVCGDNARLVFDNNKSVLNEATAKYFVYLQQSLSFGLRLNLNKM